MKRTIKRLGYLVLIPLVVLSLLLFPTQRSDAATLATTYILLNRIQANVASGVELYIALQTSTTFTPEANGIILEFPDGDDGLWCRTAGTDLVVTGVTSTPADNTTDPYFIDAALPGASLTGECVQGSGAGADKIYISGVGELVSTNTYGVKIEQAPSLPTAILGTASTVGTHIVNLTVKNDSVPQLDTKSFAIDLVADDTVEITATVLEVPTVSCTINPVSVSLGNLYQGGSYVTGTHTISTSTSGSAAGYYWSVYGDGNGDTAGYAADAGLYKSTATIDTIPSTGSGTVDLRVPNTKAFGMVASVPDLGTAVVSTDFSNATPGVFGALDAGPDGAQLLLYQVGSQTDAAASDITYGARANSTTQPGSYKEYVTFVCGGYY
jgi:hypothetical protein